MAILLDWVKQATATTGTGTITLGSAVSGFIRFQDDTRLTDGTQVYYTIEDGSNRERGIGTYTASGTTLSRDVIHATLVNGVYTENPGTGLILSGSAVVSCSAIANTHNFRGCYVTNSVAVSITSGVWSPVSFDSTVYDTDGYHSNTINNSRITIPNGVSKARFTGQSDWSTSSAGTRRVCFYKNGVQTFFLLITDIDSNLNHTYPLVSPVVDTSPGDYWELYVYQDSGSTLDVNASSPAVLRTWFSMEVVE